MKQKHIYGLFAVVLIALLFTAGRYDKFYNPIFKGDVSGTRVVYTFNVGDPTADTWLLGDTTAAGMYVPPQAIEITDVKLIGDPDSGDTLLVIVYAANGDGANEIVCQTDTLIGTTWMVVDSNTVSSDYATITTTEGMGVLVDFIAGTPNKVQVVIEGKTRINDAYE